MGQAHDNERPPGAAARVCACGVRLSVSNPGVRCSVCQRKFLEELSTPPELPQGFWNTERYREAFASRQMGRVLEIYRTDVRHQKDFGPGGISQAMLGSWLNLHQAQVSRIERGERPVRNFDALVHLAQTLRIPQEMLWFNLPDQPQQKLSPRKAASRSKKTVKKHAKRAEFIAARKAAGLTQEQLAEIMVVDRKSVVRWEAGERVPQPYLQPKLAKTLGVSPERLAEILAVPPSFGESTVAMVASENELGAPQVHESPLAIASNDEIAAREIDRLAAEILDSSTADGAINQLADVTVSLAESHTQAPARHVLTQVFHLHKQAQILLGGKQRLSQKRELFRIESDLLAHACLLLDDLKQNEVAQRFGSIALSFAQEAGTSQATARTALAKSLRWAERLIESADMAKIGYECSPATPVRIQLASQEANAAALMGNTTRAQEALRRAEIAAETVPADSGKSAWSFSTGRQAIFALSVALSTGDADAALRAVTMADDNWTSGVPVIPANWAQIRVGAGIAHLSKGSLDAAISEVTPVLKLPPELRISTVTAYMDKLDRQLSQTRFKGDKDAAELRQTIRDFNSTALLGEPPAED